MELSYIGRTICLALCGAAILQASLELIARAIAPRLFRTGYLGSARHSERSLFALTLFVRLAPWLVVLGAWLPAYMRSEDDSAPERVGLFPIAVASCFLACWLFRCVRTLRSLHIARRCCAQCRPAADTSAGMPVLLHPGQHPLLAVAGVFRSRLILSQRLLDAEKFSPASLEVAFCHEQAHAQQRDNFKRLLLAILPQVPLTLPKLSLGTPLDQQWLLAAELAADEHSAMGQPERSILLAELLLAVAKESMSPMPLGTLALLSRGADLRIRIDSLLASGPALDSRSTSARFARLQILAALAVASVAVTALCYLCVTFGHRLSELLLHVG